MKEFTVPAEYPCSGSNPVRMDGDFCGMPISGFRVFSFLLVGLAGLGTSLVMGTAAFRQLAREILLIPFLFLPFLPVATTLILVVRGAQRRRRLVHAAALGLALCLIACLGLLGLPGLSGPPWMSWGIWFYICTLLCALAVEFLARPRLIQYGQR